MAIAFARARYLSRASGGNAVRSAAYNARAAIAAERTGELFHFRHRDAPEHHAMLLPDGADPRFSQCAVLWNAAEAAERRRDAQVAREIVLALPANAGITTEDRIAMARAFAEQHFVAKGLAVQLDVHAPHDAEAESERANWHAHLLITTRRIERDGFAAKKARDLDPEVRSAAGRARVTDGAVWGELWREHQDRYFREHGLEARVDPTAPFAQEHIGPVRMRRAGSEILARGETIRQANQEAARDPAQVLAALTRNNATFTERDLDRFLAKQLGNEVGQEGKEERGRVRSAVLHSRDLVPLYDRDTGKPSGRFTTRAVRNEERAAMAAAGVLSRRTSGAVSARSAQAATAQRTLRADQAAAFTHATGAGHLKLIEGRAGTGKSYTLAAIRDAYTGDGKRVVGLAPTNAVAQDLAQDGFQNARTVHAALFALKNGRESWDKRTVVVVDEAAMLDTPVMGELLTAAKDAGAKLILTGDDRQLASIERGGLFAELRQRHGSAEITEVTRQRVDWQRQAARDLAEGRFAEAVGAFNEAGAITWTDTQDEARSALVAAWTRDAASNPGATRFVFAYTNRDVDALNAELRQVKRARGELAGRDVELDTKHGRALFAIGDRVQFTDTDKELHIANGNVGTITRLNPATGEITAVLDGAGKEGREVSWFAAAFQGFRHGYAGTIYKGQGKTLDRTYLYHTEHWRSAASYVALTRQRESAEVFVARETARDVGQLARQMARGEVRSASIAWATRDELAAGQKRQTEREARARHLQEALSYQQWQRDRPVEPVPARPHTMDRIPPLLPAWRDSTGQGRDSLGRGLDAKSVMAAIASDGAVQRERQALADYLGGAYRDPKAVQAALQAAIGRDGVDAVARQVARDPAQFGELRGKTGWLASAAKQERAGAERAASAIPDSLRRLEAASEHARQSYVGSVEAQKERDAVEIPGLSRASLDVLRAVQEARAATERAQPGESRDALQRRRKEAVAAVWTGGRADPIVAAELDGFMQAAAKRLGDEGIRTALRAGGGEGRLTLPGIGREHQAGLDELARRIGRVADGSRFSQAWEQRIARETQETEGQRVRAEERERRGLPPGPEQDRERQRKTRGLGLGR